MAGNIGDPHWLDASAKIRCGSMTTSQASGCMATACQSPTTPEDVVDGPGARNPFTTSSDISVEGTYFTSARRTARRPRASGTQSHTSVATPSCCQYSAGHRGVEEPGDGEVDVDPRLQVAEPLLEGGQRAERHRQHEGVDEVAHDRAGRAAEQHAEHEAHQHAEHVGQHDVAERARTLMSQTASQPGDGRAERGCRAAPTPSARTIDATPMAR